MGREPSHIAQGLKKMDTIPSSNRQHHVPKSKSGGYPKEPAEKKYDNKKILAIEEALPPISLKGQNIPFRSKVPQKVLEPLQASHRLR